MSKHNIHGLTVYSMLAPVLNFYASTKWIPSIYVTASQWMIDWVKHQWGPGSPRTEKKCSESNTIPSIVKILILSYSTRKVSNTIPLDQKNFQHYPFDWEKSNITSSNRSISNTIHLYSNMTSVDREHFTTLPPWQGKYPTLPSLTPQNTNESQNVTLHTIKKCNITCNHCYTFAVKNL